MGLSSYLIFVGIYSSALSLANDVEVSSYIKRSVEQEASLLSDIGTSEMEDQLRKVILNKTKQLSDKLIQDTGIRPSLEEQDIKEYVVMAIKEIKQARARE